MGGAYDIVMGNRRELVEQLIAQMEKGYAATRAAWNKNYTGRPYNPVSDVTYKGGNRLRLMIAAGMNGHSDPRWLTFKQAAEKNYKIAKGSKGVLLEKWIFHKEIPVLDENKHPVLDGAGKPMTERVRLEKPIVNYFRVFNGEQVIGLPEMERKEIAGDKFSELADRFERSSQCPVRYERQDRAYYSVAEDCIHLPPKEAFKSNETRLSVLLHEMSHSTGHPDRLDRQMRNAFGSPEYAREELNAELGSVFLENELGIELEQDSESAKDHANYLKSWIGALREDPNELFRACATAEQITEYLMEHYQKQLDMEITMENGEKGAEHTAVMHERRLMAEICGDINASGFRPTESLANNIRQFSEMEGRNYSLRELAELKRTNPDFSANPEKKACFDEIVKECQGQEIQKSSFIKQEMLAEQLLAPGI